MVQTAMAGAQVITVGATSSTSDAPIYIADKLGYFREEGLEVKVVNFRSAADMVAPLGAGPARGGRRLRLSRPLQCGRAWDQDQDCR
jgi:ABC-type nitrate/sulfonate/bicarbonate transport system substrate-binding protein